MFRNFHIYVVIALFAWASCTPDQEIIDDTPGDPLLFSTDTVLFDTVFTSVGSVTRRLRIFNEGKNAIKVPRIALARGAASPYSIVLNGDEGTSFDDVVIFGGDSLLVLVEVTIDPNNMDLPFLVKDSILVDQGNLQQHVKLVSWGQDANFLNNVILPCDETWTSDRPYVLVNAVLVDSLCLLQVEKGTQVFFDNSASLFIQGRMEVRGDTAEQVTFTSVRQDGIFQNTPGQWGGIFFLEGSEGNVVSNAVISNGEVGLRVGTPDDNVIPDLTVVNTTIANMSNAGILAFTSDVTAINTLVYNCNNYLAGNFAGGNYNYYHCTMTNDVNVFRRDQPSVQFSDNIILEDGSLLAEDLVVEMANNIVWGNLEDEILFAVEGGTNSVLAVQNNILRTTEEELDTNDNLISQELNFPGFVSPLQREYAIDSLSVARNAGFDLGITFDILGLPRDSQPDIGAFERIDPE